MNFSTSSLFAEECKEMFMQTTLLKQFDHHDGLLFMRMLFLVE